MEILRLAGVESAEVSRYVSELDKEVRAELNAFLAEHPGEPEPFALHVREGNPATVLAMAAKALEADLVIVATQGRSTIVRMLLGSVTEALMRDLDRDVLAVPPESAPAFTVVPSEVSRSFPAGLIPSFWSAPNECNTVKPVPLAFRLKSVP